MADLCCMRYYSVYVYWNFVCFLTRRFRKDSLRKKNFYSSAYWNFISPVIIFRSIYSKINIIIYLDMKIFVKAKPLSREESIEKIDDSNFIVAVREPPVKGMANQAIIKSLAHYFGVSTLNIKLVSGFSSRHKVFEIFQND